MIRRTRCLVTVAVCVAALCASLSALSGVSAAATPVPSVTGIWLAYAWATGASQPSSPNEAFVLNDKPGSTASPGPGQSSKSLGASHRRPARQHWWRVSNQASP